MMPMTSHTNPRRYGDPLGIQLVTMLESGNLDPFASGDAEREAALLGISKGHTLKLLNQLTAAGRLTRLKKGLYALNDPATKQPRAHPFAIGTALVTPSAVSHWSALQHWAWGGKIHAAHSYSWCRPPRTGWLTAVAVLVGFS